MPYFVWHGVNILGDIKKGRSFARTQEELASLLLKRDIALLKNRIVNPTILSSSIRFETKIHFFQQLASLLSAGVLLPEALALVAAQIDHIQLQAAAYAITDAVYAGTPLHKALEQHPTIFDSLMIHVTHVGQETGRLAAACQVLCTHLSMVHTFKKALRRALMMPAITCAFFLLIAFVILVWVAPQFIALFSSLHQQLPTATQWLLHISSFLRGVPLLVASSITIFLILTLRVFTQSHYGRRLVDIWILRTPFAGHIVADSARTHLVRSLAILVHSGLPIPLALRISSGAIGNTILQEYVHYLKDAVNAGSSLSQAMTQHPEQWFEQHVVAMVKVGEESGSLAEALTRAADYYQQRVEQYLHWCTALLQPLLIVILGMFIAFFVCAIYMPVFNLAHGI